MSLYRKYRPQVFADIAGQDHIKKTLQNALSRAELVHAYVFSGPRAVGKTTTARIFARAVNCTARKNGTSEPCNTCSACVSILNNQALDILEIDAASHTGVDNVRENIIAAARVGRSGLSTKVFIIDEVHMLSTSAFNALLKLLEEPPSSVIFILATTELHKVPATVLSRCQRFDFKKIPAEAMRERLLTLCALEKKKVDADVIDSIVRLSEGCQRDAESLLGQILPLDPKHITREHAGIVLPIGNTQLVKEFVQLLLKKDVKEAMHMIARVIDSGVDLEVFTRDVLEFFRTLLLIQSGARDVLDESVQEIAAREGIANQFTEEQLLTLIQHFMTAQRDSRYFSLPQLPLEVAIAKWCV